MNKETAKFQALNQMLFFVKNAGWQYSVTATRKNQYRVAFKPPAGDEYVFYLSPRQLSYLYFLQKQ